MSSPSPRRTAAPPVRPDRDLSRPLPAALSWSVVLLFVAAFAAAVVLVPLPLWLPAIYGVLSVLAFATYGIDKAAAKRGWSRVSEQTLLLLGWVGGWPGALIAQQLFRHKTRKRSFRRAFWTSVVGNILVLIGVIVLARQAIWNIGALFG